MTTSPFATLSPAGLPTKRPRRRCTLAVEDCQQLAERHAAGETWLALAAEVGMSPDALANRVHIATHKPPQGPRGHGRPPLQCGCTDTQRCPLGQSLWQLVQQTGKQKLWPDYERARYAYHVHLAVNRVQEVGA